MKLVRKKSPLKIPSVMFIGIVLAVSTYWTINTKPFFAPDEERLYRQFLYCHYKYAFDPSPYQDVILKKATLGKFGFDYSSLRLEFTLLLRDHMMHYRDFEYKILKEYPLKQNKATIHPIYSPKDRKCDYNKQIPDILMEGRWNADFTEPEVFPKSTF